MLGKIILVNDPLATIESLKQKSNLEFFKFFSAENFKIDLAHLVIAESYIASASLKTIVIAALSFTIEAQNALLKILEEPPNNTCFIIYCRLKSLLLPTIRSRMIIVDELQKQRPKPFVIDLKTLNLEQIYLFIKQCEKQREEYNGDWLKTALSDLYFDCLKYKLPLKESELTLFQKAINWQFQYESSHFVLLPLLLSILELKNAKRLI